MCIENFKYIIIYKINNNIKNNTFYKIYDIFVLQDISGGFDWTLDVLGWQVDKDQLSIVIACAIVIIVLISITIVFIIWYCCFCKIKNGKHIVYLFMLCFLIVYFLFLFSTKQLR